MKITIDSVLMCVGGAAASLLLLAGCASDKGYTVKGTIANMDKGTAVMTLLNDTRDADSPQAGAVSDTVKISDGKFTFKGEVPEASYASLVIIPEGGDTLKSSIILENAKISITANKDSIVDYTAYGMGKYLKTKENGGPNVQASDRFTEMSAAMRDMHEEDDHKRETVIADSMLALIAAYPDVEMCGYLAGIEVTSPDLMQKVYDALTPRVQQCSMSKDLRENMAIAKATAPGQIAPDFTLSQPDGTKISLSDLRGKYVVIDFWASWCKPCRASIPHLKELYAKYKKDGLEIIGVSDDSSEDQWKKAIEEDKSPWIHVKDEFPIKNRPARVGTLYGTHYIPYTFLLDKDGKILVNNAGDSLDVRLQEIFKH
jgi:peroxiredoxin